MKTEVRIRFDGTNVPGGARHFLGIAGCGPDVATVQEVAILKQEVVIVRLEEGDPRLPALLGLLRQVGESWLERHEDRYTEEELSTARLLVMQPNRQCEICGGVQYGMTYNFEAACPACGTGAQQASAVFVDGTEVQKLEGHRAGATIFWHVLVDEPLATELMRLGFSGMSFRSVYAMMPDQRQVKLRWQQMCAATVLPPMSPSTSGLTRDEPCERCRRNGFFEMDEQPTRIVYRSSDLRDAKDINLSWENVGYAVLDPDPRESLLSYPWVLVTPKVWRVFRDAGVTSFDWLPIRVEDD